MQAAGPRRSSVTNPARPSSRSGIPRPTVRTTFDSPQPNGFSDENATSAADAPPLVSQRQRPRDGASAYSQAAAAASLSFDRATLASQSGPTLHSPKSSPAITSPTERQRKASFKDLVAKFDQSPSTESPPHPNWRSQRSTSNTPRRTETPVEDRYTPLGANRLPRRGSGQSQTYQGDEKYLPPEAGAPSNSRQPGSEQDHLLSSGRQIPPKAQQLLFGELGASDRQRLGPGYGIPRQRPRRGSEGSMHYPNPMFPAGQSRPEPQPSTVPPVGMNKGFSGSSTSLSVAKSSHHRSISDVSYLNGSANFQANEAADHSSAMANGLASTSRIPVRTSLDADYVTQEAYERKNTTKRPVTPPTLTSRSHEPSPGKTPGSGQRLRAIITAPAPKISPPLRSSRPRQQVSAARSVSNEGYDRSHFPPIGQPVEKKQLRGVTNAEFATRRESIRRALKQSESHIPGEKLGLSSSPFNAGDSRAAGPSQSTVMRSTPLRDDAVKEEDSHSSGHNLRLNVNGLEKPTDDEPLSGATTHFEDDSPTLGMPGSFPRNDVGEQGDTQQQSKTAPFDNQKAVDRENTEAGQTDHTSRTVYSQIMEMRKRPTTYTSQYSGVTGRISPPAERDDAGTIQIMLGETPILDRLDRGWDNQPIAGSQEQDSSDPGDYSGQTPIKAGSGGLASNSWTPSSNQSRSGHLTLDSDAYSVINRVLDQYRESGVVSPEMVYEFQQHILETDPDFSGRDDIDSMMVAKAALEELIRDHTLEKWTSAQVTGSSTTSISFNDSADPFPTDLDGGAAALQSLGASGWEDDDDDDDDQNESTAGRTHTRNLSEFTEASSYAASSTNEVAEDESVPPPPPKDYAHLLPAATRDIGAPLAKVGTSGSSSSSFGESGPQLPEIPKTGGGLGFPVNVGQTSREASPRDPVNETTPTQSAPMSAPLPPTSHADYTPTSFSATTPGTSFSQPQDSTTKLDDTAGFQSDAKRLTQRRNLIKELVDTEFSFNQDMKVIEDIYKGTATAVDALAPEDRKVLFGNSAQVVEFSEDFLDSLKQAAASVYIMPRINKWRVKQGSFSTSHSGHTEQSSTAGLESADEEKDRNTTVGAAFEEHISRMEKVYGDYLKNHDYANQRLSKLQNVPQVALWLNECHTYANDITSAWDLDSLLVKPVQRILKYPLLLKNLLEVTPQSHPDYAALESSCRQMMDVSHRINESKKRAELLDQVVNRNNKRKEFDATLGLSKAFGRRTEKLRQQVGLSDAVEDPDYKAIAEKFGGHFFQLQVTMRDFEMYRKATGDFVKQFNRYVEGLEEVTDVGHSQSPEIESKWRKFALTIREMTAIAYADHDAAIRKHCIDPMITLLKLHDGPQKLMQKRKKRIVDYAKYMAIKSRGDKVDKKVAEQGELFIALNETLKDELPKLFALTTRLVNACLKNFVDIQAHWHSTWKKKIKNVLDDQEAPNNYQEVVDAFLSDFSIIEAQVWSLGLCNGSVLAEAANFMSYATSFTTDDASSASTTRQRNVLTKSRGTSVNSEKSPSLQDYYKRRSSSSFREFDTRLSSENPQPPQQPWPNGYAHQQRLRAGSAVSTRSNPGTLIAGGFAAIPRSSTGGPNAMYNPPPDAYPHLPHSHSTTAVSRTSSDEQASARQPPRPLSTSTSYYSATGGGPAASAHSTPNVPQSSVFSSAMPLSDSPSDFRPASPVGGGSDPFNPQRPSEPGAEPKVLFVVASAFEFNIDRSRTEAGYPYLTYVPGEIFDVIGEKGELWLAKNQDDKTGTIGWIWEKHFWRVPDDGD